MYFVFDKNGHLDYVLQTEPSILSSGSFVLQGDLPDIDNFYLFSDGHDILVSRHAPPSPYHRLSDGEWVLSVSQQEQVLIENKAGKLSQLNTAAQAFINKHAGIDSVPEFEFASWSIQASEAKAWQLDKNAPTPVLDGIATARGIPADTLKAAALRKTLAYEQLAAHVAGQRQALQSKIESAKKQSDLDKIEIAFSLPEAV